ncbi:hypothetical protein [Clostridium sp. BJN0013]|uniref:hypothetical protein n=1 Tax=Clostridium sp. BJN0013 TaxID=3236840 RepID=UPI0034C69BFA
MLKMKYKLLSALVLAAPLLVNTGIATTVHACDSSNNTKVSNVVFRNTGSSNIFDENAFKHNSSNIIYKSYVSFENFKAKLDTLATAGTITQAQETIILNLYYDGKITLETFEAQLDALVAVGTMTQSQAVSILNLFTIWQPTFEIPSPTLDNNSKNDKHVSNNFKNNDSASNNSGHNSGSSNNCSGYKHSK